MDLDVFASERIYLFILHFNTNLNKKFSHQNIQYMHHDTKVDVLEKV